MKIFRTQMFLIRKSISIIGVAALTVLHPPAAPAQTVAICSGDRSGNSIVLLSPYKDWKSKKVISEDRGLSIAFDLSGKKLVAVSDGEKFSQVNVYDASSGKLLNGFKLNNFYLTHNWMKMPDGPAIPHNLVALPDGKFAAIGFELDSKKVCAVEFSTEKELSRKTLEGFPGLWLGLESDYPVDGGVLLGALDGSKQLPTGYPARFGVLHFAPALDFKEVSFGDEMRYSNIWVTPGGFIALDFKLNCFVVGKDGMLKKQIKLQAKPTQEYRPDIVGIDGGGKIIAMFNYVNSGAMPSGRSQFVTIDTATGAVTMGPEIGTLKYAILVSSGDKQDSIYALSDDEPSFQVYSLPDFKLTHSEELDVPCPYNVVVSQ